MNHYRPIGIVLALLCASCAAAPAPTSTTGASDPLAMIGKFTADDLTDALTVAVTHQDAAAVQCFSYLQPLVLNLSKTSSQPTLSQVPGVATLFEKTRVGVSSLGATGPMKDINLHCAALFLDANATLIQLGIMGAGAVGTGNVLLPAAGMAGAVLNKLPIPLAP